MRAIGSSVTRPDAPAKVTGHAAYAGDVNRPGQKWLQVVWADVPHAWIRCLDVEAARRMPGVVTVLTDADVPDNRYGLVLPDQPVLCGCHSTEAARTVRWHGDKLCAIVADTPAAAAAAAREVRVELERLPVVTDPIEALAPDTVLIHDYDDYPLPSKPRTSNLLQELHVRYGDIMQGLEAADVVLSDVYTTHGQEHAYLEPEAGLAWVADDGRLEILSGGQWMHEERAQVAQALRLPVERIRITYAAIGGAFGGKEDVHLQILLALAAWKTGLPVKCVWSRAESIQGHHKRHPFRFHSRLGARSDGRLTALQVDIMSDAGAYASTSTKVLGNALVTAAGCYDIPNVYMDARAVFTNNTVSGAFRGFGCPQSTFMIETQMNRLARKLGMSPMTLRRRNLWQDGSTMCTRFPVPPGCMAREVLDAVEAAQARDTKIPATAQFRSSLTSTGQRRVRRGWGLAIGAKNVGFGQGIVDTCHAWIELHGQAAIEEVKVGTVGADTGQGAHTVFRQITADVLDVPLARIQLQATTTDDAQSSGSASASRLTYYTGAALHAAAHRALQAWNDEERPARGEAVFTTTQTTPFNPVTGAGNPAVILGYCAQTVEVEVDLDTGHIQVLRVVSAHDVGRAVNPQLVEGQIEGGVAQGIGWTLYEHLIQEQGRILNPSFSTYLIPGVGDVPAVIVPVIVEGGEPNHPLHIKGMAEMGLVPTAAAIVAAVHDATGQWITELPLTPEAVWRTLQKTS